MIQSADVGRLQRSAVTQRIYEYQVLEVIWCTLWALWSGGGRAVTF